MILLDVGEWLHHVTPIPEKQIRDYVATCKQPPSFPTKTLFAQILFTAIADGASEIVLDVSQARVHCEPAGSGNLAILDPILPLCMPAIAEVAVQIASHGSERGFSVEAPYSLCTPWEESDSRKHSAVIGNLKDLASAIFNGLLRRKVDAESEPALTLQQLPVDWAGKFLVGVGGHVLDASAHVLPDYAGVSVRFEVSEQVKLKAIQIRRMTFNPEFV